MKAMRTARLGVKWASYTSTLALLLAGCGFESDDDHCWNGDNDSPIVAQGGVAEVSGRLLFEDGAPASGRVALVAEPSPLDLFAGLITVGLYCLDTDESGTSKCAENTRIATLDSEGRFSFLIPEAETKGSFFDKSFSLYAFGREGADGNSASLRVDLTARHEENPLPSITLFEQAPVFSDTESGLQLTATWPEELGCMAVQERTVQFWSNDGLLVWQQQPGAVDPRLLEDFDGMMQTVLIRSNEGWGNISSLSLQSKKSPYASQALQPLSRGASCVVDGEALEPCPLTDGSLATFSFNEWATLDLGEEKELGLLVLRGSGSNLALQLSNDGQSWQSVALENEAQLATVTLDGSARYLRLSAVDNGYGCLARELSVW